MKVLILGIGSPIARAFAEQLVAKGDDLFVVGHDREETDRIAKDLSVRSSKAIAMDVVEARDFASHAKLIESATKKLGSIDGVLYAIGYLGDQPADSHEAEAARKIIEINFVSAVSMLAPLANDFEKRGQGWILGISSVAGDRGRKSLYAYGAAKSGLSAYLQGLRNRLDAKGVRVYTIKPGFVDTSMIYGKRKGILVASPERVAKSLVAILNKPAGIYYLPWFWRPIMCVIRAIPERIYKGMSL